MPPKKAGGKAKKGKGPEFTVEDIEAFVKVSVGAASVLPRALYR
jgi:hypothetical protein